MDEKQEKLIRKTIEKLFDLLQIEGEFSLSSKEDAIEVVLETKDSGMVIGYHGEVLEALQLICSLCVSKKLDHFVRVSIEIGDYKRNRSEWLESMASQARNQAVAENREVAIPNLRSWERRIIHTFLQEDPDVVSQSSGMGKDRTLIVKPRE